MVFVKISLVSDTGYRRWWAKLTQSGEQIRQPLHHANVLPSINNQGDLVISIAAVMEACVTPAAQFVARSKGFDFLVRSSWTASFVKSSPNSSPSSTELRRSGAMTEWQSHVHSCRCLRLAPSQACWRRNGYVSLLPGVGISPPVVHTPMAQ